MTEPAPLLRADRLVVGWSGRGLLPAVDLAVRPGEIWGLVGRNGNGKSTLIKTLIGILPPVSGSVAPAKGERQGRLGYVPQRSDWEGAVPARVIDIALSGLDTGYSVLWPWRGRAAKKRALEALVETHAEDLAKRRFSTLSEGQKQRVWLARALVSSPEVLILDEPTSALDALAERHTFEVLTELARTRRLAVIIASHHLGFLVSRATHLIYVDRDEGLVVAGKKDVVLAAPSIRRRHLLELAEGLVEHGAQSNEAGEVREAGAEPSERRGLS